LLKNGSLPNLQAFIDDGVFLNLTVIDHLTQTKPGHTQMLTGYRGRYTGIYSNHLYFHTIPDGYTLLERVEKYYGEENIVTCMITGKKKNLEVDAVAELERGEHCEQGIFSNVPEDIDVTLVSEAASDIVGPRMIQFIKNYGNRHFIAFFHFAEPDKQGHEFGENSKQYDEGAMSCDYWLGKILDKLDEMNIANRTLIYIMTDHGFHENEFHHRSEPKIWMATNDLRLKVNKNETRCDMIDVAPTIYYSLGINNTIFTPSLEGYPLQETLPNEADARTSLLYDETAPTIQFDSLASARGVVKFSISDENEVIGYLLLNNNLLEVYEHEKEDDFFRARVVRGKYKLNKLKLDPGIYLFSVIAFDERENLRESTISVRVRESLFVKVTGFFIENYTLLILVFSLLIIITVSLVLAVKKRGIRARVILKKNDDVTRSLLVLVKTDRIKPQISRERKNMLSI